MFSEKTLDILYKSGWSEDRRIDTSEYSHLLANDGYQLFDIQRQFLSSFGGLHIVGVKNRPDLHFDLAQTYLSAGDLEYVSDGLVTILSPVGEFSNEHELITMSSEGKIYYVYEEHSYLWANSGEEAIEIL